MARQRGTHPTRKPTASRTKNRCGDEHAADGADEHAADGADEHDASPWRTKRSRSGIPHYSPPLSASVLAACVAIAVVLTATFLATRPAHPETASVAPRSRLPVPSQGALASPPGPGWSLVPTPRDTPAADSPTTVPTVAVPGPGVQVGSPPSDSLVAGTPPGSDRAASASADPCSPSEVSVDTSASPADASPGSPVQITTQLRSVDGSCLFSPASGGPYSCWASVAVDDAAGNQVWPAPGQAEECPQLEPAVLAAGYGESYSVSWEPEAQSGAPHAPGGGPGGAYEVVGRWWWSSGSAGPYSTEAGTGLNVS